MESLNELEREIKRKQARLSEPSRAIGTRMPLRERLLQPFAFDLLDFITVVAGLIFIIISIFGVVSPPAFSALFFGIALLITTAIHQPIYQIGVLAFTILYWIGSLICGFLIGATEISLFIFGVNTISLGVFLVGSIVVASAGVLGFVEGVYKTTRWAGIVVLIFSVILALVDFFFAVYVYFYSIGDALIITIANMGAYAIALTITWGIFYLFARFFTEVRKQLESVGYETEMEVEE